MGTVDRLSDGRVIMSAGLGALHEGWTAFEADEGRRIRAQKLDECLDIYAGLMAGQPFSYQGRHYSAQPTSFQVPDPPVQRPHPPVWIVGAYRPGRDPQPSLDRAARWDGLLPQIIGDDGPRNLHRPDELAAVLDYVTSRRAARGLGTGRYDVIVEADSTGEFIELNPGDPGAWAAAGATWWIESWWMVPAGPEGLAEVSRRVQAGPPGAP